ncbi:MULTISPECIES: DinB family protein [Virgibacillus]|uniref:DinB family protein n=2 Tax=Virgibacillus TaxID=84406 RepID=A0A024QFI1_9BACI|nr:MULTISPECIES: DinB family protein [Virgibacillus]EQB37096.1 hypothetical protein M948_09445 [Virgibacillus sp. CM-4]MYL43546.1 damage-inducible protein DinB [Virgibacillus massiliensis]GGJ72286.1 DNA damage-inducible protein DinB [Virgibacillus kapii]CDQ41313.1 DinB family protein [Virgibacillus massiliensis]
MDLIKEQYDWVRMTREKLFDFLENISVKDFQTELEDFGWGSMKHAHLHAAMCYHAWLEGFAWKREVKHVSPEQITKPADMKTVFTEVDQLVYEFIKSSKGRWNTKIAGTVPWHEEEVEFTNLWLVTHIMTHEFHHKGQIVSMGRKLGYVPTDTDLIDPVEINQYNN